MHLTITKYDYHEMNPHYTLVTLELITLIRSIKPKIVDIYAYQHNKETISLHSHHLIYHYFCFIYTLLNL